MSSSEVMEVDEKGKSSSAITELIEEIEQFVKARRDLFKGEIREKLPHLRNAAGLALAGGVLLTAGYLLLSTALAVLIAAAFPDNPYRFFFGFLIVGIITVGFGAIGAFLAKSEFDIALTLFKGDRSSSR